jgi:antitoxin VapB
MPLIIEDIATERIARELAEATGETIEEAVRVAAEERLQRLRRHRSDWGLAEEIMEIGRRCAALPDLDTRSAEEILGYDESGLPA